MITLRNQNIKLSNWKQIILSYMSKINNIARNMKNKKTKKVIHKKIVQKEEEIQQEHQVN